MLRARALLEEGSLALRTSLSLVNAADSVLWSQSSRPITGCSIAQTASFSSRMPEARGAARGFAPSSFSSSLGARSQRRGMFIQTQSTPNDNSLKFLPGKTASIVRNSLLGARCQPLILFATVVGDGVGHL